MLVSNLMFGEKMLSAFARTKGKMRIGVLFAGGPAPSANQLLFAAGLRGRDWGVELWGFHNGYEKLKGTGPDQAPLFRKNNRNGNEEKLKSILTSDQAISDLSEKPGLIIGSSRANPADKIKSANDMLNPANTEEMEKMIYLFRELRIGGLISIGGDDTMRSANLLQMKAWQMMEAGLIKKNSFGVVHLPKTIDKDYQGIDYTFGFMSAADFCGQMIRGFRNDAKASATQKQPVVHVVEVMGRDAGWLTAAASVIGESTLAFVPEDYKAGEVSIDMIAKKCVQAMLERRKQHKHFSVFTLAEGIAYRFAPNDPIIPKDLPKDNAGNPDLSKLKLGEVLSAAIDAEFKRQIATTGKAEDKEVKLKVMGQKAGYVARQIEPTSFDILLCRTLGVAGVDAVLSGNFGNMVSIRGVLEPTLVPFKDVIDPITLKTKKNLMQPGKGLHALMRAMEQSYPVI